MHDPRRGPELEHAAVAALVAQPFALYLAVMVLASPPTDAHWSRADPILTLLPRDTMLWLGPALALVALGAWLRLGRPGKAALLVGLRDGVIGALVALLAVGALRLTAGQVMPGFVPPEESAAPGATLSMAAGFQEELVCRLGVLPACFFALRGRVPRALALALPVFVTGLVFALWHALGETPFQPTYFITRALIPGCVMSLFWLASPPAVVAGHCTAHLLIPRWFIAPG